MLLVAIWLTLVRRVSVVSFVALWSENISEPDLIGEV